MSFCSSFTSFCCIPPHSTSLLPLWHHHDSPQVAACFLHDALALVVLLSRLVVALLQLRHHPGIELLTPHQLRPVVRQLRLDRSPHHHVWQSHVPTHPQQAQFIFVGATHGTESPFYKDSLQPWQLPTDSSRRSSWPRENSVDLVYEAQ